MTLFLYTFQILKKRTVLKDIYSQNTVSEKSVVAQREQFPLVLAYSMTIHKAQGMTLDNVVVNCTGIFQPGQFSVAIGRAVSSNGLQLLIYRKGICYLPKSDISKFYNTENCQYLDDFSCCSKTLINKYVADTEHVPDYDSDFDISEIKFVEQNFIEEQLDISGQVLPDYIDVNNIKSLNVFNEPLTDFQKKKIRKPLKTVTFQD